MPRIPTYQSRVSAPGPINARQVTPVSSAAGTMALGQTLQNVGGMLAQHEEQKQMFETEKFAAQETANLKAFLEQEKKNAPEGAEKFTDTFRQKLQERQEKTLADFTGGTTARRSLELSFARTSAALVEDAAKFESVSYWNKQKRDMEQVMSANENAVFADPSSLNLMLQAEEKLIANTPFWDEQTRAAVAQDRKTSLYNKAIDGRVNSLATNSRTTISQVDSLIREMEKGEVWKNSTSPQQYEQSLNSLRRLKDTISTRQQQLLITDFEEQMDRLEMTGAPSNKYSPEWINRNVSDPALKERMLKRFDKSSAVGAEMIRIRTAPITEMQEDLDPVEMQAKLENSPTFHKDLAVYQSRAEAWKRRQSAYTQDPVGFMSTASAPVRAAQEKMLQDPTPENTSFFAETMRVEQEKLYPGAAPTYLSASHIGLVKDQMAAIAKDPDGAAKATQLLQSMQSQWGEHWPVVVKDLQAAKALRPEHYVAATLFSRPETRGTAELVMEASARNTADLVKNIPGGDATKRAIRERAVDALSDFRNTVQDMAGGLEIYQSFVDTIEKTLLYRGSLEGKDTSGEVDRLAGELINDAYDFRGTYRIPRSVPDTDKAARAVEMLKTRHINQHELVAPESMTLIRDADTLKRYKRNVEEFSRVVNMNGDMGLEIRDQHGHVLQYKKDGKNVPMRWTWSELMDEMDAAQEEIRATGVLPDMRLRTSR